MKKNEITKRMLKCEEEKKKMNEQYAMLLFTANTKRRKLFYGFYFLSILWQACACSHSHTATSFLLLLLCLFSPYLMESKLNVQQLYSAYASKIQRATIHQHTELTIPTVSANVSPQEDREKVGETKQKKRIPHIHNNYVHE